MYLNLKPQGVLIESDWNLKYNCPGMQFHCFLVLIESDWNLKVRTLIRNRCGKHVLIESDWNLKTTQKGNSEMGMTY